MDDADAILRRLAALGVEVTGLAADSRAVQRGDVFLAYPGARADGRRFIQQAIVAGAGAVLWERLGFAWQEEWRVPNFPVDGLRELAGPIAHVANEHPSDRLWVVGVTGTNGKTSCSQWVAQAFGAAGRKCAVVGTLGLGFPGALADNVNTTPDPITLHRALAAFLADGAQAVSMEASSIGLDQGRLNGVKIDVALFTNLSRDHLDYHPDMDSYAAAKLRLFRMPGIKHAVVNLDDAQGVRIAHALTGSTVERIGYSLVAGAAERGGVERWLEARELSLGGGGADEGGGFAFRLASSWGEAEVATQLVGRFNVSNVLGVIGVLLASGLSLADAARAAGALKPVAGRMQRLGGGDRPVVVIDYAHSPDALDKVLGALRDLARARHGRLLCVFGCGGERDPGKRPLMGEAASRHADFVIVTSDNPRGEDPAAIIAEVLPGVRVPHEVLEDRGAAIRRAVGIAGPTDVVLLAGKGHETYQEVEGRRLPFSDAEEAREALR